MLGVCFVHVLKRGREGEEEKERERERGEERKRGMKAERDVDRDAATTMGKFHFAWKMGCATDSHIFMVIKTFFKTFKCESVYWCCPGPIWQVHVESR